MSLLPADILEAVLKHLPDPVIIVNSGHSEWPVSFANAAFRDLAGTVSLNGPVADMCEKLIGRNAAVDVSEAIRRREATRIPVEIGGREIALTGRSTAGKSTTAAGLIRTVADCGSGTCLSASKGGP